MKRKVLLSWSCGKDSAWALHVLKQDPTIEVVGLVTTINSHFERVAIHGIRKELLELQVEHIGLPLYQVAIPYPCRDGTYENAMKAFFYEAVGFGVEYVAFGDLFLQNVREYREKLLGNTGLQPLFPLWGIPTSTLSLQMIASGLKAIVSCVDAKYLSQEFSGREYNQAFLDDLPDHVDPCGENGEFHTLCVDGPMFQRPLEIEVGQTILRQGVYFTDLLKGCC